MKIAVVGDERLVWGFSLAGVKEGVISGTPQGAEEAISRLMGDPGIGIILLPLALADTIRPFLTRARLERRLYPLIVELGEDGEGARGSSRAEHEILRMAGMTTGEPG